MKNLKTIISLIFGLSLFLLPAKAQEGISVGFTFGSHSLDQAAEEDVDANGTVDAKHSRSDSFKVPALTASYTKDLAGMISLTVGAEYVPVGATLSTTINTDTDSTDKATAKIIHISPTLKFRLIIMLRFNLVIITKTPKTETISPSN